MRTAVRASLATLLCAVLVSAAGCDQHALTAKAESPAAATLPSSPAPTSVSPGTPAAAPSPVPIYTYEIVNTWSHDPTAFTQGLVYLDGGFVESTGLNGQSTLRKVELPTGRVLQRLQIPAEFFAEGLAVVGRQAFQLTWQNHQCFVYDLASLRLEKKFTYDGEGWGLTTDGTSLILSDGTDQLQFLDPATFAVKRTLRVVLVDHPASRLNELEFVQGEIFANVWGDNYVLRIDPASGRVTGIIDFSGLLAPEDHNPNTDVLNGIAYDAAGDRLFVTGKRWPKLFEVRLKPKS